MRGYGESKTSRRGAARPRRFALAFLRAAVPALALLAAGGKRAVPPRATPLVVDVWTTRDGLPQGSVNALIQTRDGYLWLGTFDGLVRFDGVGFTVFHTGNLPGLSSNRVIGLQEGADGSLWVGTEGGGVCRCRAGRCETYRATGGPAWNYVGGILEDGAGGAFVMTFVGLAHHRAGAKAFAPVGAARGQPTFVRGTGLAGLWIVGGVGLARLDGGDVTPAEPFHGIPAETITALVIDGDGVTWVAADGRLHSIDGPRRAVYGRDEGLPEGPVRSVVPDGAGGIWIDAAGGIARLADGRFVPWPSAGRRAAAGSYRRITRGGAGALWVIEGDRAACVREGAVVSEGTIAALAGSRVREALADREGTLWIGTQGNGLLRVRPAVVRSIDRRDGLPHEEIQCVLQSRDGSLWLGTNGGGLIHATGSRFTRYGSREGLPSEAVWSLLERRDGELWIGTWNGPVRMKRGRQEVDPLPASGLQNDVVLAMLEDRRGELWLGTYGNGLKRLRGAEVTTYTTKDGLANDFVRAIFEDRHGDVWVGTDGGVSRVREAGIATWTTKDGLSDGFVRAIHEDGDGSLWFGTYGNGLNRMKGGKLARVTPRDGLFDRNVSAILEDGEGTFWMSSNRGIFRVGRRELDALADGGVRNVRCVSFAGAEGMADPECNGGSQPSAWKAADGTLLFPTARGLATVDPRDVRINLAPPPVVIERILVDQRTAAPAEKPTWAPGRGDVQIGYAGLSFANPAKVLFRYRLEGFDPGWVEAGSRREAFYTRVPPGTYRFRVIACNDDGVWNSEGASLTFTLLPHFYETRWFLGLCVLCGALVLAGVAQDVKRRMRARDALLKERDNIAREIHDGLAQGMSGVVLHLQAGLRARPDEGTDGHLATALGLARASLSEARRLAKGLHSEALPDPGRSLPQTLEELVRQVGAAASVETTFAAGGSPRRLSSRLEINLLRIAQEALQNAIRHSGCRTIHVALELGRSQASLTVRDDGRGFGEGEKAAKGSGLGLRTMEERARELGGRLEVVPSRTGVTVTAELPLRHYRFPWSRR